MNDLWRTINNNQSENLAGIDSQSINTVLLNTKFDIAAKLQPVELAAFELSADTANLINESLRILKFGGLFFVYGLPQELPYIGEFLTNNGFQDLTAIFKYWITLEIDDVDAVETLAPRSMGLLMFLKSKTNSKTPSPFILNTSKTRTPHNYCSACGQNTKDWGGKKHLMNPVGTALSDVWRDFKKVNLTNHIIPDFVLERIYELTATDDFKFLYIQQTEKSIVKINKSNAIEYPSVNANGHKLDSIEVNKVYNQDCVSFLDNVSKLHPDGFFDLVFADPPYNLQKDYSTYKDSSPDKVYLDWCEAWLAGMAKTLKAGGSLFILNLPKWSMHHSAFLNRFLEFRHWVTWDALSDPRGKIMPAHYSLLYFTKKGAPPIFNYGSSDETVEQVQSPDSPIYCLRASCVKTRKKLGDDKKEKLSDVWFDIHRIKHKRDRDAHPCQLPTRLLERIIKLTTIKGGIVFDPFSGAGTTAMASLMLGRQFVTTEIDPDYVQISNNNVESIMKNIDLFGEPIIKRASVRKIKHDTTKKEVELYLQGLALKLGKEPSETDISTDNPNILEKIDLLYPSRLSAIKQCRVVLR